MSRGPKPSAVREAVSVRNMREAWGETAPDWVVVLAEECDRTSQNLVASRLDYSAAVVSSVLRNRYQGDLAAVETAVMGAFKGRVVACPVLGEIPAVDCLSHQRRSYTPSNPAYVRLFRACRNRCPHQRGPHQRGSNQGGSPC